MEPGRGDSRSVELSENVGLCLEKSEMQVGCWGAESPLRGRQTSDAWA